MVLVNDIVLQLIDKTGLHLDLSYWNLTLLLDHTLLLNQMNFMNDVLIKVSEKRKSNLRPDYV